MRIAIGIFSFLLVFSGAAMAREARLSSAFSSCMDKSDGVTAGMIDCINAEHKRQDTRLNKAYKVLIAEQTPARKKELQDVQRLWLKYRDANCAFYYDPDGGSMARINANSCVMDMTADRALELENMRQQQ